MKLTKLLGINGEVWWSQIKYNLLHVQYNEKQEINAKINVLVITTKHYNSFASSNLRTLKDYEGESS